MKKLIFLFCICALCSFAQDDVFSGTMPVQIEFVEAEYDSGVFEQGIFGDVVMYLLINEEGMVDEVSLIESLNPILDEAAMRAAKMFRFSPAMLYDSIAVAVVVQYVYSFFIEEKLHEEELEVWQTATVTDTVYSDFDNFEVVAFYREEQIKVSKHQLRISEMRRIPGLSGDAVKVVQALPGVARPIAILGDIVVRGTSNHDSKFFLDGTEFPVLHHFAGLKSTYNSEALEAIDFYPGGWGSQFGDATGGVVELRSRRPKTDRVQGHLDLGTLDMSVFLEGPISDKWSFLATARRSHFGEILQWGMRNFGEDGGITIAPFYWDYIVRADFAANDRNHFTFSSFSSKDSLALIIENANLGSDELGSATDAFTNLMFFTINGMCWDFRINDNLQNSFTFKSHIYRESLGAAGFARLNSRIKVLGGRNNLGWQIQERARANFGIEGHWLLGNMELDMVSDRGLARHTIDDGIFGRVGVYTNFELRPIERWLIVPGIRYDYFHELDYSGSILPEFWDYGENVRHGPSGEPAFRLSTRFSLNDNHLIKGAIGTYNQSPKPLGMAVDSMYGNPQLRATNAAHFVLGYEWQITPLISLDITAYRNNQWNIPRQASQHDLANAETADAVKMFYGDEKGKSRGIEIMLRHRQSDRFMGWIAYTLSQSMRKTPHTNGWVNFDFDQTHNLQLLASYRLPRNWELGGRFRYTTGNPTTPIAGIDYDLTSNWIWTHLGELNSARLDPFVQFDVRAQKKWEFNRTSLTAYLDIQNLLYFAYTSPEFTLYDDFRIEKRTVGLPIIPTLGVRFDF